ncbi:PspC domain-containing protein [Fodinicola acaciae]|uniref:PspC domain-containing protein n=1 Tax=Fodinicola acaciae TaxID=2681555 RepID=UPI0013D46F2C|nr:PspC domain-containing protein [Fodinicola acaciae]
MDSTTGADTPPPAAPPRPATFSDHVGITRPKQGRIFFGVCAGLAKATNTDPLLWRVILGVLVFFNGVGVLFYLLGILLLAEEGDEVSPLESLVGRGRASLHAAWTILLTIVAGLLAIAMLYGGASTMLLAAAAVIGLALLLRRPPGTPQPVAAPPPAAEPSSTAVTERIAVVATDQEEPQMTTPTYTPPPSYAPHGPFEPPPPPPPPMPSRPPKPPKEPSRLGRVVFFLALIAVGSVAVLVATTRLDWTAYLAIPLGIIGVGLLIGSRYGRARWLIPIGLLLSVALLIGAGINQVVPDLPPTSQLTPVHWTPTTTAQISPTYRGRYGDATLDLRQVDFTGKAVTTSINVSAGELRILLPEKVDVDLDAQVSAGSAQLFGRQYDGLDINSEFQDHGSDGPGGGRLNLRLSVGAGEMEVTREAA